MEPIKQQAQQSYRVRLDAYTAIGSSVAEADDVLQGTCKELLELPVCRQLRRSHN